MAGVLRLCYLVCGWLVCHGCASLHVSGWRVEAGVCLIGWCVVLACVWLIDVLRYSACDCLVCRASSHVIGWRAVLVPLATMVTWCHMVSLIPLIPFVSLIPLIPLIPVWLSRAHTAETYANVGLCLQVWGS